MRFGKNGDPLSDGKLDLPELREQPVSEELAWARQFVARRTWRDAVTYRETAPHEYIVRSWEQHDQGDRDFACFVGFIRRFGFADYYYRIRHIYWALGDFKYWTMGWPVEQTTVINRARLDAPEPWKDS